MINYNRLDYAIKRVLSTSRTGIQGFLTKKSNHSIWICSNALKIEDTWAFAF